MSMIRAVVSLAAGVIGVVAGACSPGGVVAVESADGRVRIEVTTGGGEVGAASGPTYRVLFDGRELVGASSLGLELGGGGLVGPGAELAGVSRRTVREEFVQVSGRRREVVHVSREAVLSFRGSAGVGAGVGAGGRGWELVVRAADDGAAFRYRLPGREGSRDVVVRERTSYAVPGGATVTALPLGSFTTSHEARYLRCGPGELPAGRLLGLPLLIEMPGACGAIAEAALDRYAGMYLAREDGGGVLVSRLSPLPGDAEGAAVRCDVPMVTPWRVILAGPTPSKLLESDFILALNEPRVIADTSWIRPGKTTFPWWNGYADSATGGEVGLDTRTTKSYIDFCAAHHIAYHTLDGKDDLAWYGGPIAWNGADPTRATDGLDLPAVLEYAKARGVGIRVWMHWKAARAHMERAFPLYHAWGIRGVMIDFMDRDDQEMVAFLRRALELAAANRLTVVLHGVSAPTGLERTFPNLLGSEGVMNLEYNKWDKAGVSPEHEMTAVFTRMLAGPMDFHQGGTRMVQPVAFAPRWRSPVDIGTPTRTLASYVVYQNHLPMMADDPSAYAAFGLTDRLASVPETWDQTRGLAGAVGEFVVVARRAGDTWWVAAMTNSSARSVDIPLGFLGQGRFAAEIVEDGPGLDARVKTLAVDRGTTLRAEMAPAGAWVAKIAPR